MLKLCNLYLLILPVYDEVTLIESCRMAIQQNLQRVQKQISVFEQQYHRIPGSVRLLAASKGQPTSKLREGYEAGQKLFGENYLQEAFNKMQTLSDCDIEWHFIGRVQSNKARKIAALFAWVHSVTDLNLAERLNNARPDHLPPLHICIEVNIDHETSKSGVAPHEAQNLIADLSHLPRIAVRGLMAIPAPKTELTEQRKAFQKMYQLWNEIRQAGFAIDTLSMGMSDDFEAAIAEGSTLVRIGTNIFGERTK